MVLGKGYFGTSKWMVLTADNALSLIRDKVERERAASLAIGIESNWKAVEAPTMLRLRYLQVSRMLALEMNPRAAMTRMRVEGFRAQSSLWKKGAPSTG